MKMKTFLSLICTLGFVGWGLWSCSRMQSYSEIPEIHFKKIAFADSIHPDLGYIGKIAFLSFSFIDGDGDLGVKPEEKNADGTNKPGGGVSRIYYTWHKKLPDRTYEPFQFPVTGEITISSEIPYRDVMDKSEAQNKTLKGSIEVKLMTPINPQGIDTMRIEFYIVDRAKNKSNVDHTPDFSILNPPDTELTQ